MPLNEKPSTDDFRAFIEFGQEADRVLSLSIQGISHISKSGPLAEVLARLAEVREGSISEERGREVEEAHRLAELAQNELNNDFPLLHAHTVVSIWSALDSLVPRFAVSWLISNPHTLDRPEFENIRVPVNRYEGREARERMEIVIEEFLRTKRSSSQHGVGRYEVLLSALGLGGGIDDALRRDLYEFSQVRNLIVHRSSVVDQRFVDACPWLSLPPGAKLRVSHQDFERYRNATMAYVTAVIKRVTADIGSTPVS